MKQKSINDNNNNEYLSFLTSKINVANGSSSLL